MKDWFTADEIIGGIGIGILVYFVNLVFEGFFR